MSIRVSFLLAAMTLTACGAAPTGRSTLPVADITPLGTNEMAKRSPVADPTLPDKQVSISAEGAFASK